MTTDQLTKVRELIRQLSFQEKLYLLNDLTMQVIQQSSSEVTTPEPRPLPSIHLETWPNNLPLRREELYDDRGR
ncbi:MAG TPA: hypothetical protein DEF43_04635 [Chloroflexus aurantiacus]|jgi:hypothetical protein|nr:MAG: hypothetical protein D6716_00890 [Chloroflexota bacterium]GIV91323.1 MAG: hypothetical protein KatS3mg056_0032 [Chloroflexus sp.]HBW66445.1 hypothetical protein [Chloroflexus aurantiacus]